MKFHFFRLFISVRSLNEIPYSFLEYFRAVPILPVLVSLHLRFIILDFLISLSEFLRSIVRCTKDTVYNRNLQFEMVVSVS